ncbi:MAG: orotate phosphoribosyltransferase [Hyphomicrobium zavarzinii]|uniref:orotate phosphoribosyltransferase n=1 Tax=Hyphomicrobium zavarzinii TaxID=48292 RepID=UPI001A47378E|nr:orotate phosphoribosyltransferase [Hyphomicrobium zavarzinii]MBL8846292.1 orotate phosphoribosyltransferase [Hyphomicrobium zavarzinii]
MTNAADARARLFDIIKSKSFVRGHVVLASGKESDHYFDMKPSMFDPEGAELLAELLYARIASVDGDIVGGLEMGAVPLITPISIASRRAGRPLPGFFVRKTVKDHGTKKLVEGLSDVKGKRVVIVEDVTTTGGSAMKAVEALTAAGATIVLVISILDREENAKKLYADAGIPFASLFKASEFLKA